MTFTYWPGVGLVTCARCLTEYDETSDSVTWVYGDQEWRCTYEEECDNALFEQQQGLAMPTDSERPSWSLAPYEIDNFYVLECPRCAALVERDSTDKHDAWHDRQARLLALAREAVMRHDF